MIEIEKRSIHSKTYSGQWRKYNCFFPDSELDAAISVCKDRKAFWELRPKKYHKDFRVIKESGDVLYSTEKDAYS